MPPNSDGEGPYPSLRVTARACASQHGQMKGLQIRLPDGHFGTIGAGQAGQGEYAASLIASEPRASEEFLAIEKKGDFNVAAHGLRGLAALMVMFAHIFGGAAEHIYADNPAFVQAVKAPWYLGTFGVELFFVISGFVILPSALRYLPREFALRRFLRLYPLFFVLSLVFLALNHAAGAYPRLNNLETAVSGLLFINLLTGTEQLTPNAWSLTYEVMFYVLMYSIVYFTIHNRQRIPAFIAIIAALAFVAAFPIALYFVVGAAIRLAQGMHRKSKIDLRYFELPCMAAMVFFATRGHFEYHWHDFANPAVMPLVLSTGSYFYCAVCCGSLTSKILDNRIMRYFGTTSYSLYLVHPYTYYAVRLAFIRFGIFTEDVGLSMILFTAAVTALTLPLTHMVHISLELWPYQQYFGQRVFREQAHAASAGTGGMP